MDNNNEFEVEEDKTESSDKYSFLNCSSTLFVLTKVIRGFCYLYSYS